MLERSKQGERLTPRKKNGMIVSGERFFALSVTTVQATGFLMFNIRDAWRVSE